MPRSGTATPPNWATRESFGTDDQTKRRLIHVGASAPCQPCPGVKAAILRYLNQAQPVGDRRGTAQTHAANSPTASVPRATPKAPGQYRWTSSWDDTRNSPPWP